MDYTAFGQDSICSIDAAPPLSQACSEAIQNAVNNSQPVGFAVGYYDEALTISRVSRFFLQNLGYTYEEFMEATHGSLRELFYGENQSFLSPDRWPRISGAGDAQLLSREGVPLYARIYKEDSVDEQGRPVWVITAKVDWNQQNLCLVNAVIQSGLWYIDYDETGRQIGMVYSHEFRVMLGYHDVLDFPNRLSSWADLLHPDDRERVLAALEAASHDAAGTVKYDVEYRMKMPDGRYQWFRDSAETIRRLNGSIRRMVGVFINIDEKKRAELSARRSEAFHQAYTEANVGEYYVDLRQNRFESLKAHGSLLEPYEKSATWDELVRAYLEHSVQADERESVGTIFNRGYIAEKLGEGKRELSCECRILINGQERWIRNVVMRGEAEDASRYAIVLIRDITDARNESVRIAELARQNRMMDLLLQGMIRLVDSYALCDLNADRYTFYAMKEGDRYPREGTYHDLVERIAARFHLIAREGSIRESLAPENITAALTGSDEVCRFEYGNADESQYKSVAIIPVAWAEGKPEKILLIAQDTTQEKQTEQKARTALKDAYDAANRANSAKTAFLSNMSHDIRTPMNAIVGMTAIARANIGNQERVVDCLSKITQASRHLLSLINEVLDMSRIESGKVVLTEEEFNLGELVDNLVAIAKPSVLEHHHQFEVRLAKIEHEAVRGDSLRLQQMILNILSNAIKYTPDGGRIVFSLSERPARSANVGCYEFRVEDNGIGMTPEFQKVLFEPFARADDQRTGKIQGTGLGMTITRNIVNMMNGTIDVKSAPGKGSTFTVTIFLKLQDTDAANVEELADLPVLVVDDDEVCRESAVEMLNEIGIAGEAAASGPEAVARTVERHRQNEDFFAVLLDWQMPGMDGIETTREIRRQVGREVPIIVLTAYDYTDIEAEARKAGVDDFIAKPLFRSRLTAALKNLVAGRPIHIPRENPASLSRNDFHGKHILLVEDNQLNREIAKELIEMTGASVEAAENGKDAVERFLAAPEGSFDLIFMDIQMPLMNGYQAAAAIRSTPKGQKIPIVAMTANAFAEDVILSKNAGMNEHLAKPLDLHKLNDVLKRWL